MKVKGLVHTSFPWLLLRVVGVTGIMGFVLWFFLRGTGVERISFAFWVNVFLMLWATLARVNAWVHLPERYWRVHNREVRLYRALRLRYAQRFLARYNLFNPRLRSGRKPRDLAVLDQEIRDAETGHLVVLVLVGVLAILALCQGRVRLALALTGFNGLLNGIPVVVQRYNRARLRRIYLRRNTGF